MSLVSALFLAGNSVQGADTVNRIIAIVNDEIITSSEVEARFTSLVEEQSLPDDLEPDEARRVILRRLIEQHLILQEAGKQEVEVRPEEIDERLDTIRKRFDSEEEFRASMAASDLTIKDLKDEIHKQFMVQKIIDGKVRGTISVSPQEVARYIEEHPDAVVSGDRIQTSHILIRVGGAVSEEHARAKIESLHQRLAQGEGFAELAAQYSEDPHREDGGDMGWVAQGELLPALDATLFALAEGEVSEPVQTRLGFHLLKAGTRRLATSLSAVEDNQAIFDQLYQKKYEERFRRWVAGLAERAYIEIVATGWR